MEPTAKPPATCTSQHTEQVVLDYCRWLFNQDVRIITFFRYIRDDDDDGDNDNYYITPEHLLPKEFTAIVLPKTCSLPSLADADGNEKILIKTRHFDHYADEQPTREYIIDKLLQVVQKKIAGIMNVDLQGKIRVERSSVPAGYNHGRPNF